MTRSLAILALCLVGCQRLHQTNPRREPNDTGKLAVAAPDAEGIRVRAECVARDNRKLTVGWTIENSGDAPAWVPVAWGTSDPPDRPLPVAFVVPPADVMLVFAYFDFGRARGQFVEASPDC